MGKRARKAPHRLHHRHRRGRRRQGGRAAAPARHAARGGRGGLLTGDRLRIPVHSCRLDHGRDGRLHGRQGRRRRPGCHPRRRDRRASRGCCPARASRRVSDHRRRGVGRITKPGLELPPGEPAINPGPRRMITQAVGEALSAHGRAQAVAVEIFVPQGEEIARKTLNARLGIIGGISILGTTGIVRPLSHEAFTATIRAALSVAGHRRGRAVLTHRPSQRALRPGPLAGSAGGGLRADRGLFRKGPRDCGRPRASTG